jgi:hypothetical protein
MWVKLRNYLWEAQLYYRINIGAVDIIALYYVEHLAQLVVCIVDYYGILVVGHLHTDEKATEQADDNNNACMSFHYW